MLTGAFEFFFPTFLTYMKIIFQGVFQRVYKATKTILRVLKIIEFVICNGLKF